jgi:RNase P protein component
MKVITKTLLKIKKNFLVLKRNLFNIYKLPYFGNLKVSIVLRKWKLNNVQRNKLKRIIRHVLQSKIPEKSNFLIICEIKIPIKILTEYNQIIKDIKNITYTIK